MLELDDEYSDVITEKDLKQPFTEFFIYTGEYNDPQIGIKEVKDVEFEAEKRRRNQNRTRNKETNEIY